jgi:predicted DNA-binding transcriptional regulator YafY
LLTLGMTKTLLTLFKDTPIYDTARHLMDVITAPLADSRQQRWYEDRVIVPQVASVQVSPELWRVITQGLRENRVLSFDYRRAWDDDFHPRRVRPWQLLFDNGSWFLYGYCEERRNTRIFSLSRIKNAAVTEKNFSLPKDFDYRGRDGRTGKSYFGIFSSDRVWRFRIALYGSAVSLVRERTWADDQKIEELEDGVVMAFSSSQYDRVLEWALSRGCLACPLEPAEFVDDWHTHIKEMQKLGKCWGLW